MQAMEIMPFKSAPSLTNSRVIPGVLFHFLAKGEETNHEFALIQIEVLKGNEPPRHTHERESESYFIQEGSICFTIGDEVIVTQQGDFIHLPSNIPHEFKLVSDKARVLMWLSPAGLDEWFWDNSAPAETFSPLPISMGPPPPEVVEGMVKSLGEYGVRM